MQSRRTRQTPIVVFTTLALTSSLILAEVTEIVLRVNDRIATTYDYTRRRRERVQAISQAEDLSAERRQELIARVGEVIMTDLLENLLLLSRADQLGLDVSEGEISEAVGRAKQGFGIETDEEFRQALAESGMSEQDFREQMRSSILVQQVMGREVQARISLEEEDLRRYYQSHTENFQIPERLRLQEVVVVDSADLSQDDMALLAEAMRQQVLSGRELEEVVGPYAEQGVSTGVVDLGWVEVGDLDKDLEEAVWGLQAGEVSEAVRARGGMHVLIVGEREEARLRSFLEVQTEIEAIERARLMEQEVSEYMQELKAKSYIVVNPPPEAAGFRASVTSAAAPDLGGLGSLPAGSQAEEAAASRQETEPSEAGPAEIEETVEPQEPPPSSL